VSVYEFATGSDDAVQHAREYDLMQWINKVPIRKSRQADRIEHSGLPNLRSASRRLSFEFEPRSAGQTHLGQDSQTTVWLKGFYSPAIDGVADADMVSIAATAAKPDAADQQVEQSAQLPQTIGVIPSSVASDLPNRDKSVLR
jgi:hypothetical protein